MNKGILFVSICLVSAASFGQANDTARRAALRARWDRLNAIEKRINETRPQRRDSPMRGENIYDDEVREIQTATRQVLPEAIVNISSVVTGCPCEEGSSCTDQVWILAYRPDRTIGLLLSKINDHWTIGPIQKWWLEHEELEARRNSFHPITAYFDAEDMLKEKFPACSK